MKKLKKKNQAGVMNQISMREFDRLSVPRPPRIRGPSDTRSQKDSGGAKTVQGNAKGNRRKKNGRAVRSLKMKNPPHPGFVVRVDCLQPHGLTVTKGAKILGVSRSALSRLVNESADLSWDMAIRAAKAFGSTPEGWMRLQFQYDAALVKERAIRIEVTPFRREGVAT